MRGRQLPGVLELWGGFLLDAEDDNVGATDADRGVALADCFQGVLDLEKMAIGGEYSDGAVIASHDIRSGVLLLCYCY